MTGRIQLSKGPAVRFLTSWVRRQLFGAFMGVSAHNEVASGVSVEAIGVVTA
jgi:hypothetical protein